MTAQRVFLLYSPVSALVLQQIVRSPSLPILLVLAVALLQTWAIALLYDGLVRDRSLLNAEVAREYGACIERRIESQLIHRQDRKVVTPMITERYWREQEDRQLLAELEEDEADTAELAANRADPVAASLAAPKSRRRSGWAAETGEFMRQ